MSGAYIILQLFQDFYRRFPFLEMEQAIEYFSLYGGVDFQLDLDLFDDMALSAEVHFVQQFESTGHLMRPTYLSESPYRDLLTAIARGDGRLSNIYRRARIGEAAGREIVDALLKLGILTLEHSRQAPLRAHPKHSLKKHLRHYRIEPKVRFVKPFYRFWFGFVLPYRDDLLAGRGLAFMDHFDMHKERNYSLLFEQLSTLLLAQHFQDHDPILSQGSFWDQHSEFDLLSISTGGKIILGECKYTSRPVTRKELTKLKDKAMKSGIRVDYYALFSKSGFSHELLGMQDENLMLFDLDDFSQLLSC